MKKLYLIPFALGFALVANAQNVGIGQATPISKIDVNGNVTVGSTFSGVNAAPANGARIQGHSVMGRASGEPTTDVLHVNAITGEKGMSALSVDNYAGEYTTTGNAVTLRVRGNGATPVDVAVLTNATTNTDGAGSDVIFCNNNGTGAGTGYGTATTREGVLGQIINGTSYSFGVVGGSPGGGAGSRYGSVGGVMSGVGYPSAFMAYKSSGGTYYGSYTNPNGNTATGSGTGKMAPKQSAMIGTGVYGGVMGSWVRGEQYGMMAKGAKDKFSMYVDGKTFTNNTIAQLSETTTGRVATYVPTGISADVTTRGKAQVVRGKAFIAFNQNFASLVEAGSITATVTPMGYSQGAYIAEVTKEGMTIMAVDPTASFEISWIAIGTKANADLQVSEEILANDFDSKMDKVMFNEGNEQEAAAPIWWDGSKIRFDAIPDTVGNPNEGPQMKKSK